MCVGGGVVVVGRAPLTSMHLLRMMAEREQMAVVSSWICIVLMCLEGRLKRLVRVLRVEVWIPSKPKNEWHTLPRSTFSS